MHDSGAERTLVADLADELGVPFAPLSAPTLARLDELLDEGLLAENPLDLWGTGAATRELFGESLRTMAADPAVSAVALAIDLVEEYDGDTSYVDAALDYDGEAPLVVLANLAAAIDPTAAAQLRAAGVPVLEGTRSGLVALRHLLALAMREPAKPAVAIDVPSAAALVGPAGRADARSTAQNPSRCSPITALPVVACRAAATEDDAVAAAAASRLSGGAEDG